MRRLAAKAAEAEQQRQWLGQVWAMRRAAVQAVQVRRSWWAPDGAHGSHDGLSPFDAHVELQGSGMRLGCTLFRAFG